MEFAKIRHGKGVGKMRGMRSTLELLNIAVVEQCYIVDVEWSYILASPVVLEHSCIVVGERHYIAALVHLYIVLLGR